MPCRRRTSVLLSASLVVLFAPIQGPGQTPAKTTSQIPRMPDGKPNFTGLWQALGTAYWDIQDHSAHAGPFFQLGATGAEPAGQGIVEAARFRILPRPRQSRKKT